MVEERLRYQKVKRIIFSLGSYRSALCNRSFAHWQGVNLSGLSIIRTLYNVAIGKAASNHRMTAYSELERCARQWLSQNLPGGTELNYCSFS
jgi:hypothetical protein